MSDYQRLPIYILADRSGSMTGAPISSVNQGISTLVNDLQGDSRSNEIGHLALVSFADDCRQDVPLTEIQAFTPSTVPELKAGGRTAFGAALRKVADCIKAEVRLTDKAKEVIGDFAPLLFILTDGEPTDDWRGGWQELRGLGRRYPYIVAVACGPDAKPDVLQQLIVQVERNGRSEPFGQVIVMNNMSADSFKRCFQLLSQKSMKFGENPFAMAPAPTPSPVFDPLASVAPLPSDPSTAMSPVPPPLPSYDPALPSFDPTVVGTPADPNAIVVTI